MKTKQERLDELNKIRKELETPYIKLEKDKRKSLVFDTFKFVQVQYEDKMNDGFELHVIREDGEPVDRIFRSCSKKLWSKIETVIDDNINNEFIGISIKKFGSGHETTYDVEALED